MEQPTNADLARRIARVERALFDEDDANRLAIVERALFHEDGTSRLEKIESLLQSSKVMAQVMAWLAALAVPIVSIITLMRGGKP